MNDQELVCALRNTPLHPLLILVSTVLSQSGFGDVQILDRRENRQKSRFGGHELECRYTVGGIPSVAVVKVVRDSVRLRMLSELAGTVLYRQADLGILVATGTVSSRQLKSLAKFSPVRIEVIDGAYLAELLTFYKIGVRPHGGPDYAFLSALDEESFRFLSLLAERR